MPLLLPMADAFATPAAPAQAPTQEDRTRKRPRTDEDRSRCFVVVLSPDASDGIRVPVPRGGLVVGREPTSDLVVQDGKVSRQHVRVVADAPHWRITDLDSRNGTFVDGARITGTWTGVPRAVRIGDHLLVPVRDHGRTIAANVSPDDGAIAGVALRHAWSLIEAAARDGLALHLHGASGTGKEVAARRFHDAGTTRTGPFVAVNCAAIPVEIAERVLFGARKGAFSGAVADAEGLVQAAHGGTLFLDEIGELPLAVQAKLLRVLETREVTPLGATRSQRVEIALVSATHADLEAEVARGRFRADLYYRIAGYVVAIPSLAQRLDEVAAHVRDELARAGTRIVATPAFIESCVLRPWPGNVRELRATVRRAATEARLAGATMLDVDHLPAAPVCPPSVVLDTSPANHEKIEAALRDHGGNVSATARALGVHRNQLRRWMSRPQR